MSKFNLFKRLKVWREERGLHEKEYSRTTHASFIAEELTELLSAQTPEEEIDAYCDEIVFCINAIENAGYNAEIALQETLKEIESRKGEIVNGKFCKYKDEEHMALWHKADYSIAKLLEVPTSIPEPKSYQGGTEGAEDGWVVHLEAQAVFPADLRERYWENYGMNATAIGIYMQLLSDLSDKLDLKAGINLGDNDVTFQVAYPMTKLQLAVLLDEIAERVPAAGEDYKETYVAHGAKGIQMCQYKKGYSTDGTSWIEWELPVEGSTDYHA